MSLVFQVRSLLWSLCSVCAIGVYSVDNSRVVLVTETFLVALQTHRWKLENNLRLLISETHDVIFADSVL